VFLSKIERHNAELRRAAGEHLAVADADLTKAYRDAVCPPADYPQPARMSPEDFRRGPITEGHDALSAGYQPPSPPAPPLVPDATGGCP
jgi:hypothetical protein